MKRNSIIKLTLLVSFILIISSACSHIEYDTPEYNDIQYGINSKMDKAIANKVFANIEKRVGVHTRAGAMDITEDEAKDILDPFTEEGYNIQQEIEDAYESGEIELSQEDYETLTSLEDEELAALALVYYLYDEDEIDIDGLEVRITKDRFINCMAVATGLDIAKSLINGTVELMTVRSALAIAKALVKRYYGYIGIALAVIEFIDCVDSFESSNADA